MKIKHLLTLLTGLMIMPWAQAEQQTLQDAFAAEALCSEIMVKLTAGEYKEGLMLTKPYFGLPPDNLDQTITTMESQAKELETQLGKSVGWEKISEKMLGSSVITYVYLQKLERHPLVWRFTFYRASDTWSLNTFEFQKSLKDLLQ